MTGAADPVRRRSRRAAAGWLLVVVSASVVDPAVVLGSTTTGSAGPLPVGIDAFVAAHLVAYGVLGWLVARGLDRDPGTLRTVVVAVAVATAAGVGVELLQAPLAARTASATDVLVNAAGAVVGAGAGAAVRRR